GQLGEGGVTRACQGGVGPCDGQRNGEHLGALQLWFSSSPARDGAGPVNRQASGPGPCGCHLVVRRAPTSRPESPFPLATTSFHREPAWASPHVSRLLRRPGWVWGPRPRAGLGAPPTPPRAPPRLRHRPAGWIRFQPSRAGVTCAVRGRCGRAARGLLAARDAEGGAAWGAGQDTALELPELTPEEKRVLERKLKKERRKEERKQLRKDAAPSVPAKPSGAQLALDYLRGGTCGEVKSQVPAASPRPCRPQWFSSSGSGVQPVASAASIKTGFPGETQLGHTHLWAQKHEKWKFQKTRQTWLLLHMYDNDQVPDELFSTLLAYLEGLRGRARELTVQKAEALMQKSDEARGADTLPLGTIQRVRQVLQLLS
uniref:WKF domain-containing protein n=1 Tax=Felis catus TaxID=9685 RepID=A0ABI7W9V6_FELCA